jgi:glyoxylase-like metal-dependent hydrolase (beta-lactamase superfamily II)
MSFKIQVFTFNPFQENTYVVYNAQKEAVIIDPGCYFKEERTALQTFIEEHDLAVLALLNTHCHLDHIFGNAFVLRTWSVDFYAHELDLPTLRMAENACKLYGLNEYDPSPEPTHFLQDKQTISFGSISFEVIFAPGHAPGHVAFYSAENNILIGGDILFEGSYGRTDLPGGDAQTLKKSILERIFPLPESTYVLSGHGNYTTIGAEKKGNPIHYL